MNAAISDRIRVLCVDDDTDFLDLTRAWLTRTDEFSVRTENDPRAALSALRKNEISVDAVVSDYQMPEMDGLSFLERVRESRPDLPFILFTGEGNESIASRAITAGVTDYLQKHSSDRYDLLVNRVRNAVESHRARLEVERERHIRDLVLAATPVGIVGHDCDGDVLFLNDRAMDILLAPADELDGSAYASAGWTLQTEAAETVSEAELPYRRVIESKTRLDGERYRLRTSDGTEQKIVVYGSPLWDETGQHVEGAVIAFYLADDRE